MTKEKAPPSLDRLALGSALAAARNAANKKQNEVAAHFGVKDGTVSAWEKGRGIPDALTLKGLAKLYETSPNRLLNFLAGSSPLSDEVCQALERLDPAELAKVEKILRAQLDIDAADDGLGGGVPGKGNGTNGRP